MTLYCAKCSQPLPVHTFPGAIPERQAVFTIRDGARVHADPCPQPQTTPINQTDEE